MGEVWGSGGIIPSFMTLEVSGQLRVSAALPPRKERLLPIGGCVVPRADLDKVEKKEFRPCRKSNPGSPAHSTPLFRMSCLMTTSQQILSNSSLADNITIRCCIILWHTDPLLRNAQGISKYTQLLLSNGYANKHVPTVTTKNTTMRSGVFYAVRAEVLIRASLELSHVESDEKSNMLVRDSCQSGNCETVAGQ
jgi:hypothetical protein